VVDAGCTRGVRKEHYFLQALGALLTRALPPFNYNTYEVYLHELYAVCAVNGYEVHAESQGKGYKFAPDEQRNNFRDIM
jgi:hypothetical protein